MGAPAPDDDAAPGRAPEGAPQVRLYIVSPMRIYREGLAHVLAAHPQFLLVGSSDVEQDAAPVVRRGEVDVVLYDVRCPSGCWASACSPRRRGCGSWRSASRRASTG